MSAPEGWFAASIAADLQNIPDYNTVINGALAKDQKIPTPNVLLNQGNFFDPVTSIWMPPAGLVVLGSYCVWELESGQAVPEGSYIALKIRKNGGDYIPFQAAAILSDDPEIGRGIAPTSPAALGTNGEIMDVSSGTDTYELYMAFFVAAGALHRLQATGNRTRFWGIAFGA